MIKIKVANYSLGDLLYALECSSIDEVACTTEDSDLLIIVDSVNYKHKKYKSKNKDNKETMVGNQK